MDDITTHYGPIRVLHHVDMEIYPGEMVCLLGGNASGKSTTLKTILGIVRPTEGTIELNGERVEHMETSGRIERGLAVVPENRRIFPKMTVKENLEMGAYLRKNSRELEEDFEYVFSLFPRLGERLTQLGGTMSGGEQQMLAMGRALMLDPKLLMLDEPSAGLAPLFVDMIFEKVKEINETGVGVLMVEQNARKSLELAHRGYVLATGQNKVEGLGSSLLENPEVAELYLGGTVGGPR